MNKGAEVAGGMYGVDVSSKLGDDMTRILCFVQCRDKDGLELLGKHDVNRRWIADVRQDGSPMVKFTVDHT